MLSLGLAASAAGAEGVADLLRLDKSSKSIPLWTPVAPAEANDLSALVNRLNASIYLVGNQDGRGTAWVISKENRLLATNAHVADIMYSGSGKMYAIGNRTSKVFDVEAVYYHPGVLRLAGDTAIRMADPAKGDVYPSSADVAILKLAPGDPLPEAIPLATPDEVFGDLLAKPCAMLGYPGSDTTAWPRLGERVEATFHQGVVCRVSDFTNDVNAPEDRLQFLQHSMANFPGFSGSPIFMPNGHVIALNNSGMMAQKGGLTTQLSFGVRVDCLWECIKQHGLWNQVAVTADIEKVDVQRFTVPDPKESILNEARRLVARARIDLSNKEYEAAIEKLDQAEKMLPNFEPIYDTRANAYSFLAVYKIANRSKAAQAAYALALADAYQAAKLLPSSADHALDVAMAELNFANSQLPAGKFTVDRNAIALADKVLGVGGVRPRDRAYAYRTRAFARGLERAAIDDLNKAVVEDPWIPQNYSTLRIFWNLHGNTAEAQQANDRFERISKAQADSDQAWLIATSRSEENRNGYHARELAEGACQATDYQWWQPLRALAAAHAEVGDFNKAVELAEKAIAKAPFDEVGPIRRQLQNYQRSEPWRED